VKPRVRTLRLALAVAAGLLALLIVDLLLVPIDILTPHGAQVPLSPLYALWAPAPATAGWGWSLPALVLATLVVVAARRFLELGPANRQLVALATVVLLTSSFALTAGGPAALTAPFEIYAGEDYSADLPLALAAPGAFLDHFAEIMPRLSLHGSTHPPGFTLLLATIVRLLGPSPLARALTVILLGGLAVLPLHALARRRHGEDAAGLALLLYATVPSVLLYTATSLDAILPLPAIVALDALDRVRTGRLRWAAVGGLAIGVVTFLSFSGLALLGAGGLLLVLDRQGPRPWRRAAMAIALMLGGCVAPFAVLAVATGFDPIGCFAGARANLAVLEEQMKGRGQHPWRDWIYTTLGNTVAFAIGLGSTVVAACLLAVRDIASRARRRTHDGLLVAALATLVVMAVSGVYLLEVERIWLFLMPPLVAAAAGSLTREGAARTALRPLVAIQIGQAVVLELLLDTFW
jgi:hypothetical protein